MFFVFLEGLETDSAKSSLGFLDDLSEGHLLFFLILIFFYRIEKKSKKRSHLKTDTVPGPVPGAQKGGMGFP